MVVSGLACNPQHEVRFNMNISAVQVSGSITDRASSLFVFFTCFYICF